MLDLVFRNGQAPSLNSDNLNAMVTAINRNELKAVDLQEQVLKINNTEVIANPDKKPRYSLRTVSIGDKVYLVDGNSGTTMYNLLGTQSGEVVAAFYPEENTKQIVLMAIYDRHYQGAATIDLENKTIQATAASVEKEIYDKYVGQLWDDNHSVGNSFTYNVIADNWYEFYWNGNDGYGTETLKVDESGKLLVNSSFYALEVAVFSLEKTSVITADTGIEKTEAEYLVIEQAGAEETDAIYFITDKNYIVRNKIRYANIEHKAENTIITDEYSASKSYIAGDYLIFNNTLYKVKIACSGVTPPNTTYYEAVTVVSEVTQLKTSLNELETDLIYKFSVVYGYSGNLNDLPAFSVAECLNSCTNLPFGALHSTVITIRMASNPNFAHQLCISGAVGHDRSANFMALRTKWSGSWGNWVTIK